MSSYWDTTLYHKGSNIAWLQLKPMLINALTVINVNVRTSLIMWQSYVVLLA